MLDLFLSFLLLPPSLLVSLHSFLSCSVCKWGLYCHIEAKAQRNSYPVPFTYWKLPLVWGAGVGRSWDVPLPTPTHAHTCRLLGVVMGCWDRDAVLALGHLGVFSPKPVFQRMFQSGCLGGWAPGILGAVQVSVGQALLGAEAHFTPCHQLADLYLTEPSALPRVPRSGACLV